MDLMTGDCWSDMLLPFCTSIGELVSERAPGGDREVEVPLSRGWGVERFRTGVEGRGDSANRAGGGGSIS